MLLCNWLLHSQQDRPSQEAFVRHADTYLRRARSKFEVGVMVKGYVDAEAYEQCLSIAEYAGIKTPRTLKAIRSEAQMCIAWSLAYTGGEYSVPDVNAALQAFLTKNLDEWLERGRFSDAAQWLKIAYWNGDPTARTPQETLMQAYDHLPGRTPPRE